MRSDPAPRCVAAFSASRQARNEASLEWPISFVVEVIRSFDIAVGASKALLLSAFESVVLPMRAELKDGMMRLQKVAASVNSAARKEERCWIHSWSTYWPSSV